MSDRQYMKTFTGIDMLQPQLQIFNQQKENLAEARVLAQCLNQGVDDLACGRLYQGASSLRSATEEEEEKACIMVDDSHGALEGDRTHEELVEPGAEMSRATPHSKFGVPSWLARNCVEESADDKAQEADSQADSQSEAESSDDFLELDTQDIREILHDHDDDWRMRQAEKACTRSQRLLNRLKTSERVKVMSELNSWFESEHANAAKNLDHLKTHEELRSELERSFNERFEQLRSCISKKEMNMLMKLNNFSRSLHRKTPQGANARTVSADARSQQQHTDTSNVVDTEFHARFDCLEETIKHLRTRLAAAQEDIKRTESEIEESSIPKVSELLQIIADQQEEMAALNTRTVLVKKRIENLDNCAKVVKAAEDNSHPCNMRHLRADVRAARTASKRITAASSLVGCPDATIDMLNEVRNSVKQKKLREVLKKDTPAAARMLQALDAQKASSLNRAESPRFANVDLTKQFSVLSHECQELNTTIEHSKALRDSDAVANSIIARMEAPVEKTAENLWRELQGGQQSEADIPAEEQARREAAPELSAERNVASKLKDSKCMVHGITNPKGDTQASEVARLLHTAEEVLETLKREKDRLVDGRTLNRGQMADATNVEVGVDINAGNAGMTSPGTNGVDAIATSTVTGDVPVTVESNADGTACAAAQGKATAVSCGETAETSSPRDTTAPKGKAKGSGRNNEKLSSEAASANSNKQAPPALRKYGVAVSAVGSLVSVVTANMGNTMGPDVAGHDDDLESARDAEEKLVALQDEEQELDDDLEAARDAEEKLVALQDEEQELVCRAAELEARLAERQLRATLSPQATQVRDPQEKSSQVQTALPTSSNEAHSEASQVGEASFLTPALLATVKTGESSRGHMASALAPASQIAVEAEPAGVGTEQPMVDIALTAALEGAQANNAALQSQVAVLKERIAATKAQVDHDNHAPQEAKRAAPEIENDAGIRGPTRMSTVGDHVAFATTLLAQPHDITEGAIRANVGSESDSVHGDDVDGGSRGDALAPRSEVLADDRGEDAAASAPGRADPTPPSVAPAQGTSRSSRPSPRVAAAKEEEPKHERYYKAVSELYGLHIDNTKLQEDIATVERQIKLAKSRTDKDAAEDASQAAAMKKEKPKAKELPKIITELRHEVGKKQHELSRLRQHWWQARPTKQGKASAATNRWHTLRNVSGFATMVQTKAGASGDKTQACEAGGVSSRLCEALSNIQNAKHDGTAHPLLHLIQAAKARAKVDAGQEDMAAKAEGSTEERVATADSVLQRSSLPEENRRNGPGVGRRSPAPLAMPEDAPRPSSDLRKPGARRQGPIVNASCPQDALRTFHQRSTANRSTWGLEDVEQPTPKPLRSARGAWSALRAAVNIRSLGREHREIGAPVNPVEQAAMAQLAEKGGGPSDWFEAVSASIHVNTT